MTTRLSDFPATASPKEISLYKQPGTRQVGPGSGKTLAPQAHIEQCVLRKLKDVYGDLLTNVCHECFSKFN